VNPQLTPGLIVELRSRLWRIDDVQGKVIVATNIDGSPAVQRRFYLPFENVRVASLGKPSPGIVGNFACQRLLLKAYQLSLIHGSAPLLSLQRSRAVPVTFQMVPVIMSLEMPRVRMLIADDVGLGKTIEAGLIVTELLARQRASKLLVIVPANLREQWREALDYFFHIEARIISSRHRRMMERELTPGANPWEYYPYLIVSMDYAKKPEIKAQILEQKWDIVLVDEAHNLAKPHQVSLSNGVKMQRWELLRDISKRCRHLILLTATPHNGYTDTFASLIRVLHVGAVSGPDHNPTIQREVARRYVCQRRRKDVLEELTKTGEENPFPTRDQNEVIVTLSELEHRVISKVEQLGGHILSTAGPEGTYRMRIAKWTVTHLHKRALSSPRALVCSLRNRLESIERRLQRAQAEEMESPVTEEEAKANVLDRDTGERLDDEETGSRMERIVYGGREANLRERQLLTDALRDAQKIVPSRDSKLRCLLDNTLREMYRRHPKVIVFTRYKDTLDYLANQISSHRFYQDAKIVTLDGSLNESQRKERFKVFMKAARSIMIATDCISEGINLQTAAFQMIHYELPWNPNRLEQRTGRIDRYGQLSPIVYVRTMVVDDKLEAAILKVLVRKAMQIREEQGFCPPFFGDDVSILDIIRGQGIDVEIGQMKLDRFLKDISVKDPPNPFSEEAIERIREENFYGQTEIDLSEVRKRIRRTEELIGSKDQIKSFVVAGLRRFGCEVSENPNGTYKIDIRDDRLLPGLKSRSIEMATFDPRVTDPDIDVLGLGHPLVRNLIELIKQETFEPEIYGRTACIGNARARNVCATYTFLVRYAVNTEPRSIVEEIINIGLELFTDRVLPSEEVQSLLQAEPRVLNRTEEELKDDLRIALEKPNIQDLIDRRAEERRSLLSEERRKVREALEKRRAKWVEGIDELSVASKDLLAVTLHYPTLGE